MFPYLILIHTKGKSSLLHIFPLNSWAQDSWRQVSPVKTEAKKHWVPWPLACHLSRDPCAIQQQPHIFSTLPFAANIPIKALLAAFHFLWETQLQAGFGFPDPIPACSGLCHLSLLAPLICFQFYVFVGLFIHAVFPLHLVSCKSGWAVLWGGEGVVGRGWN